MTVCSAILDVITRRKSWDAQSLQQTEVPRSLNVVDLIGIERCDRDIWNRHRTQWVTKEIECVLLFFACSTLTYLPVDRRVVLLRILPTLVFTNLGIGSCAGLGIFVTSAHVARWEAGPAVVLSVLVASVAAVMSGLSHIELATRLPQSGSGYTFCYVTFGELLAFVIGWNVILENIITGALATKAAYRYLEYMCNQSPESNGTDTRVAEGQVFESTPDIYACCAVIAVTVMTLTSVKTYSVANFILMTLSCVVLVAFICVGFFHVAPENWNSAPGFFARGFQGIMSGAAVLMSTFASIDNLTSCAEDSQTPCRSLPTAFNFVVSVVCTFTFLGVMALTLATPWQQLSDNAALARAYDLQGIFAAKYVIGLGAIFGLLPVVMGSLRHPVRLMCSMSNDHLLPKLFSKTAFNGIIVYSHIFTGILVALCSLILDISTLLEISALATTLQFVASPCILLFIRYQPQRMGVGICREYSKLDVRAPSTQNHCNNDMQETKESNPMVILLANGDHRFLVNEQYCQISNNASPCLSTFAFTPRGLDRRCSGVQNGAYNLVNDGLSQQSLPPTMTSVRRPENLLPKPTVSASFESDKLRHNILSVGLTNYGLSDVCADECTHRDGNYSQLKNCSHRITSQAASSKKPYFLHADADCNFVLFSPRDKLHADDQTWRTTRHCLLVYLLSSAGFSATSRECYHYATAKWWVLTFAGVSVVMMLTSALLIARQPQNSAPLCYRAPYVPLVPLISVTLNMLLLASLPAICWIRLAFWLIPGLLLYVFYSCRHSSHQEDDDQEAVIFDVSQLDSR